MLNDLCQSISSFSQSSFETPMSQAEFQKLGNPELKLDNCLVRPQQNRRLTLLPGTGSLRRIGCKQGKSTRPLILAAIDGCDELTVGYLRRYFKVGKV